ncbi:MAG: SDR family NAD(P)-dependent oxidoreductase, partial [Pseudomonadota bacterium]
EDLRAATGGEGVDFVLNALAGEFIPASLSLLREGGRFVEIGKTDEWDQARIDREYPGRRYAQLYLGDITESRPDAVCKMLERVYADFDAGVLTPLPHASWPLERAEDAFRFMAQGLHTGKIVLTQTRPDRVREDASYLVTGGLRGIGLRTAQWLAASGARHLVLVSRSGPGAEAAAAIEALEAEGVRVRTAAADVADEGAMAALFAEIATEMPPLAGIVHAAGVLDDAMLADQTPERFATVMAPKVRGGWILHRLTERMTLDFFVLFASGAGLMGAPGQANYASANGFLDALAHHRRALGLPALSVDWGSWSEVGMAAGLGEQHHRRWSAMGLGMIAPDDGVRMLGDALFGGLTAQVAIIPVHRARLPASGGPLFRRIAAPQSADAEEEGVDIAAALAEAAAKDRPALLGDWLGGQVARVLALDATQAEDRNRSLMELGMDSLMAMELHNRIKAALGVTVSAGELLTGPTVNQLLETVQGLLPEPAAGAGANSAEIEWEEDTI